MNNPGTNRPLARDAQPAAAGASAGGSDPLDDPRVLAAVQEYLAALESGARPERSEFLKRHSAIATPLATCLDGLDFVHGAANQLRGDASSAALPPAPAVASGGTLPLGDFRVLREIGRGGMGIVYEAQQLSLNRRVAVKVLPFAAALDPKQLQRFKNEAQAAAQLHHAHIVPVYAVGSERGVHFYAMQLIDGQPLSALVDDWRVASGRSSSIGPAATATRRTATRLASGRQPAPRRPTGPNDPTMDFPRSADAARAAQRSGTQKVAPPPTPAPTALPPKLPKSDNSQSNSSQSDSTPQPSARRSQAAAGSTVRAGLVNPASTVPATSQAEVDSRHRTAVNLIRQAALGLDHAHQVGVIHRDIKPANLLIDERGNVWITDFGLAQFQADANLTRTGDVIGTLRYMSPEQAAGNRLVLDHRTDIYSLGVTLYELLVLEPVFDGTDRHGLLRSILEEDPRPPRSIDKHIPVELETIVLKSIAKAPHDRYATAQEMADDLQRFLDDQPIKARRPTILERAARWRRRHRSVVISGIVLLFLASLGLLGSTILIAHERNETEAALVRVSNEQRRAEGERKAAQANFEQARKAVDTFVQIGEEETASHPQMQRLRRRFLQAALDYYRDFLSQHNDDPSVQADLATTSKHVEDILDELSTLEGFGSIMLLARPEVQRELNLSPKQRDDVAERMRALTDLRRHDAALIEPPTMAERQQHFVELLKPIQAALDDAQWARLQQIGWQQRGANAFAYPKVWAALDLTSEQRQKIYAIADAAMLEAIGRGPDGDFDDRPGTGGPRRPGQRHPQFNEREPAGPPPTPPARSDATKPGLSSYGPEDRTAALPEAGFPVAEAANDVPLPDRPGGRRPASFGPGGPVGRGPGDHGRGGRGFDGDGPDGLGPERLGPEGRGPGRYGPGDRGPGDRGPGDHDPGDHDPGDHDPGDRGPGDHGPGDRGDFDRPASGLGDLGPSEHGPGRRGFTDQGPDESFGFGGPRRKFGGESPDDFGRDRPYHGERGRPPRDEDGFPAWEAGPPGDFGSDIAVPPMGGGPGARLDREALLANILAVLTPDQLDKWNALIGSPVAFDLRPRRPAPPPR